MKKILFEITQEYYWAGFEPIYRAFSGDKGYDLYLRIGPNQVRKYGIFLFPQKRRIERIYQSQGYRITDQTSGFDAVICGTTLKHPRRYGAALLVNVDHGPGIKTLRYRAFLKQPDIHYILFVEGRYRVDKLCKYGLDKNNSIIDVGLPKLDPLFNGAIDREAWIRRLRLDPNRKTVLYAPSYKPTSIPEIIPVLPELLSKYNVIVKLHPYSWNGKYAPHWHHRLAEDLAKRHRDLRLIPRADHSMLPYLYIADTLISDGSSVINEFLALGRIGIIVNVDQNLSHSDGQPLLEDATENWLKDSFIHIHRPRELSGAVEQALYPAEERQRQLIKDRDYIFSYTDGKSALRVKDIIDQKLAARQG